MILSNDVSLEFEHSQTQVERTTLEFCDFEANLSRGE